MDEIIKCVKKLESSVYDGGAEDDALSKLESELEHKGFEDVDGEEAVLEDPEVINESLDSPYKQDESKELLHELKKLKPIVAGIEDTKQRKAISDSMAGMLRKSYGMPHSSKRNGYADIGKARQTYVKDSSPRKRAGVDLAALSAKIEADRLGIR